MLDQVHLEPTDGEWDFFIKQYSEYIVYSGPEIKFVFEAVIITAGYYKGVYLKPQSNFNLILTGENQFKSNFNKIENMTTLEENNPNGVLKKMTV